MAGYPEYNSLQLPGLAEQVLAHWQERRVFERSLEERSGRPPFIFYEGPPSANGLPGIHHVMARTIKDIFCRYKTQKGFLVERKGGWDTHGLPIEISVEKTLGITKEDIGDKISIEDYNRACRKEVMKYKSVWDDLTRKMGYWVDLDHPYITFDNSYIETCWYLLQSLYKKGLLYKGYTIQPFSPAAGTGLSSHELNQPGTYKLVKDTSVVAQFMALRDEKSEKLFAAAGNMSVFLLAWTTTPWTLPSNSGLAVGESIRYVLVRTFNPYTFEPVSVVLAKDLMGKYFTEKQAALSLEEYQPGNKTIPFKVLAEFGGGELAGIRYEQLLPYVKPEGDAFRVVVGDFVSTEDGTGIVHLAPTFGADDFRVCKQHDIPAILVKDENGKPAPLVDRTGRFVSEVTDFALEHVKEDYLSETMKEEERTRQGRDKYLNVDERIAIKLKQENKAFKVEKYEHTYPHCWRTDKPVLYYPLDSWFIRTTACKDRLIELNKTINWKPESTGTGRFGNWLENLVDWNLSRSRYWGIPLPIWRSEDGEEKCIGSSEELYREICKAVDAGLMPQEALQHLNPKSDSFDLHRPYVDHAVLVSSTGKPMLREPDLIDVWFDSGAMPYAQWHYPFGLQDLNAVHPADFIAEGVDQTRGWFFTLHAISVMLFDKVAFKNVVSNGLVLDKNGNKMSKRLGNAVDPFTTLEAYGPDATRWYMISNAQPWDNLKFNVEGIAEVQRKFFGTLYNTYGFFALYANIDGFRYEDSDIPVAQRTELDRWILSLLNSLIRDVDACYAEYEPTRAARLIQDFVNEHLSNWYVRLSRRRFWKGEYTDDKKAAYQTLYTCLDTIARLIAPVSPFFADRLYMDLNGVTHKDSNESVHLANFPVTDSSLIDKELEERMQLAQDISSMTLSLRKKVNIRVRQPLRKILLPVSRPHFRQIVEAVAPLILSEVNVEEIEFLDDAGNMLVKKVKPNFKALGPKAGGLMKQLSARIAEIKPEEVSYLEQNGILPLRFGEAIFDLMLEDVEILNEDIPGWQVASQGALTVALDTTITEDLREKGIARELVNRIQNIRKDKGLEVTDRIAVRIKGPDTLKITVQRNFDYIRGEILATELEFSDTLEGADCIAVELDENLNIVLTVNKYPHGH